MSKATSLYWGRKVAALEASLLFAHFTNLKIVTHNFK
jgi:hypothetical protein